MNPVLFYHAQEVRYVQERIQTYVIVCKRSGIWWYDDTKPRSWSIMVDVPAFKLVVSRERMRCDAMRLIGIDSTGKGTFRLGGSSGLSFLNFSNFGLLAEQYC